MVEHYSLEDLHKSLCRNFQLYRSSVPLDEKAISRPYLSAFPIKIDGLCFDALGFIPWTRGCWWYKKCGGCFMCSYNVGKIKPDIKAQDIIQQFEVVANEISSQEVLGIFPYSTMDLAEFPVKVRTYIYKAINELPRLRYVLLETTAELVTSRILDEISHQLDPAKIIIFLGVETSSDFVRRYCMNKSYTWEMTLKALNLIRAYHMKSYAFVLMKPPSLSEEEAVLDALRSVRDCISVGFSGIDLRVIEIAKHSLTDILQCNGLYEKCRPESLVSVMANLPKEYVEKITINSFTSLQLSSKKVDSSMEDDMSLISRVSQAVDAFNRYNLVPPKNFSTDSKTYELSLSKVINWDEKLIRTRLIRDYKAALEEIDRRMAI